MPVGRCLYGDTHSYSLGEVKDGFWIREPYISEEANIENHAARRPQPAHLSKPSSKELRVFNTFLRQDNVYPPGSIDNIRRYLPNSLPAGFDTYVELQSDVESFINMGYGVDTCDDFRRKSFLLKQMEAMVAKQKSNSRLEVQGPPLPAIANVEFIDPDLGIAALGKVTVLDGLIDVKADVSLSDDGNTYCDVCNYGVFYGISNTELFLESKGPGLCSPYLTSVTHFNEAMFSFDNAKKLKSLDITEDRRDRSYVGGETTYREATSSQSARRNVEDLNMTTANNNPSEQGRHAALIDLPPQIRPQTQEASPGPITSLPSSLSSLDSAEVSSTSEGQGSTSTLARSVVTPSKLQAKVATHPTTKEKLTKAVKEVPGLCRFNPWPLLDVKKIKLCTTCYESKKAIMSHPRHTMTERVLIDEKKESATFHDAMRKECMICLNLGIYICEMCPLQLCTDCEVLLRLDCRSFEI